MIMIAWMVGEIVFFVMGFNDLTFNDFTIPVWTLIMLCLLFGHVLGVVIPTWKAYRSEKERGLDAEQGFASSILTRKAFDMALSDPLLFQDLKAFTASDFSIENALFVEHLQKLRRSPPSNLEALQKHYKQIFLLFLSSSAELQLNIPATSRERVKQQLDIFPPNDTLFDEVLAEVKQLMFLDTYPRFIRAGGDSRKLDIARLLRKSSTKSGQTSRSRNPSDTTLPPESQSGISSQCRWFGLHSQATTIRAEL